MQKLTFVSNLLRNRSSGDLLPTHNAAHQPAVHEIAEEPQASSSSLSILRSGSAAPHSS